MFKPLKLAAKAYGAVSGAVGTIAHPIRATQDAVRGFLVKRCVNAVMAVAGERVANELVERVQFEKPLALKVKVPARLRDAVLDKDLLEFVSNMANDAMAAPLAALGLRIGSLQLVADEAGEQLMLEGTLRLMSAGDAPRSLLPSKGAP